MYLVHKSTKMKQFLVYKNDNDIENDHVTDYYTIKFILYFTFNLIFIHNYSNNSFQLFEYLPQIMFK